MFIFGGSGKTCKPSAAAEWTGNTAVFGFVNSDVTGNHAVNAAIRTLDSLDGDASIAFTWQSGGNESQVALMYVSSDFLFNQNSSSGGAEGHAYRVYAWAGVLYLYEPSNSASTLGAADATAAIDPTGKAVSLTRTGGVVTLSIDGVIAHTFSTVANAAVRALISMGNSGVATDWRDIVICRG